MAWLPLDPALLRVGLYIKIDHAWMQHPFVRNTFTISSPTEIAIIQKHRLTKLFYDPVLSHADVVETLNDPSLPVTVFEVDADLAEDIDSDEKALLREKSIHIQRVVDHWKAVDTAARDYIQAANETAVMIAMANAGQPECLKSAEHILQSITKVLDDASVGLTLVSTVNPADEGQEMAMQAISTTAMSMLTCKTLKINDEERHFLGMGALFHNIGMNRIPLAIRLKTDYLLPVEQKLLQMYPQFGKEILGNIPGVPQEVIEVVYQHRECLDGTGFPKRLIAAEISPLARLVGLVVEFTHLTNGRQRGRNLSATQALSQIYVNMKPKYGPDMIEAFIASVTVFPPGSFVQLNEGSYGLVVKSNTQERLRPVIMLYEPDASHNQAAIIDLMRERSLSILKSIDEKAIPSRIKEVLNRHRFKGYAIS
ncbi:MAG: DUF3391 domain-containing protein [Nitrospira sp.]|nr:DUF3391 domain-containing protein [Nitrospira sp.]